MLLLAGQCLFAFAACILLCVAVPTVWRVLTHKRRVCLNTDNRIVGAHTQSSRDPVSHRTLTLLDGQEGRHVGNRPPVTTHFQPCGQGRSSESLRLPASLLASLLPTKRWDVVPSSTPALSNACPNGTASLMRFETSVISEACGG